MEQSGRRTTDVWYSITHAVEASQQSLKTFKFAVEVPARQHADNCQPTSRQSWPEVVFFDSAQSRIRLSSLWKLESMAPGQSKAEDCCELGFWGLRSHPIRSLHRDIDAMLGLFLRGSRGLNGSGAGTPISANEPTLVGPRLLLRVR
jgi:hypothetical protein